MRAVRDGFHRSAAMRADFLRIAGSVLLSVTISAPAFAAGVSGSQMMNQTGQTGSIGIFNGVPRPVEAQPYATPAVQTGQAAQAAVRAAAQLPRQSGHTIVPFPPSDMKATPAAQKIVPFPSSGAQQVQATQPMQPRQGAVAAPNPRQALDKPLAYHDPKRDFVLVAPPGSRFKERADGSQITIQSRRGYGLHLQVGNANPNVATSQMFSKLEAKYLGNGKPWTTKSSASKGVIAGLPAGIAVYEANSTRTEVVIARGRKTDFVFMFFAPIQNFEKLRGDFQWILASFRPAPDEKPAEPPKLAQDEPKPPVPLRTDTTPSANPAGRPEAPKPAPPSDVHWFAEAGYGYRVAYPEKWTLEKTSAFTNVISGPKGTPAYDAIVAVQNVSPQGVANGSQAAQKAYDELKTRLMHAAERVQIAGEKPVTYAKDGMTLHGKQFVANYDHEGRRFRKWALVLPRPDGTVAHIWSYTAPVERFDTFRPVAEQILNSLRIEAVRGAATQG